MTDDRYRVLETSQDPQEIVVAAIYLARSARADDHAMLARCLRSAEFLGRLDSQAEYLAEQRLRFRRVIEALRDNTAASAREVIVSLTQDPVFLGESVRVEVLIDASAVVRPPPPELVQFWDKFSQPEGEFTYLTIDVLIENGSEPALTLLEKKIHDPKHEEKEKIDWMRTSVSDHRYDPPVLDSCQRMLAGGLAEPLNTALLEVLFDPRIEEWFHREARVEPPPLSGAGPAARTTLHSIGESTLAKSEPADRLKRAIQETLEEIEGRARKAEREP